MGILFVLNSIASCHPSYRKPLMATYPKAVQVLNRIHVEVPYWTPRRERLRKLDQQCSQENGGHVRGYVAVQTTGKHTSDTPDSVRKLNKGLVELKEVFSKMMGNKK